MHTSPGIWRWMSLGILVGLLWLVGCGNGVGQTGTDASRSSGGSEPSSATAMPTLFVLPTLPVLPAATPTPQKGNDAPVSAADTAVPGPTVSPPAVEPVPSAIIGRVIDVNKEPIAGAIVLIVKGSVEFPERTWLTDDQGHYTIFISPGSFTIGVNAEGHKMAQQDVVVTANHQSVLDFQLERQ